MAERHDPRDRRAATPVRPDRLRPVADRARLRVALARRPTTSDTGASPASRPRGSSATTRPERRCTSQPPVAGSTGCRGPTSCGSTATPAPRARSRRCSRSWRSPTTRSLRAYLTARTRRSPVSGIILEAERAVTASGSPALRAAGLDRRGVLLGGRYEALGSGDGLAVPVHDRVGRQLRPLSGPPPSGADRAPARHRGGPRHRPPDDRRGRGRLAGCATDHDRLGPSRSCAALRAGRARNGRAWSSALPGTRRTCTSSPTSTIPSISSRASGRTCGAATRYGCTWTRTGQGSRVDVKLTLAQTPSGPQVWDWVGQGVPARRHARLERSLAGGYRYEVALPWESLHRPGAGARRRARLRGRHRVPRRLSRLDGNRSRHTRQPGAAHARRDRDRVARADWQRDPRSHAIALRVDLDGQVPGIGAERTSPDRDYLWLDRLAGPLELSAGEHESPSSRTQGWRPPERASSTALWLIPRPLARTWVLDDGSKVTLELDPAAGTLRFRP